LECLTAVVREGSFERAAAYLSVTQSAVSQRLRALEDQVGVVLVVRSRPIAATAAGMLIYKHAMHLRLLHADLHNSMKGLDPSTADRSCDQMRVSVAIHEHSISTWALPALDSLACGAQGVEIITDHRQPTYDWLRQGRVLGCVSTLHQSIPGCSMSALGAMRYVAVAHPGFAARHCPHGLTPHNFHTIPFVACDQRDDLQYQFVTHLFGLKPARLRQLLVPTLEGQIRAVRAQWGVSVVPELYVSAQLRCGELIDIAPGAALPIQLYWHCWGLESATLSALTEAVICAAAASLIRATSQTRSGGPITPIRREDAEVDNGISA